MNKFDKFLPYVSLALVGLALFVFGYFWALIGPRPEFSVMGPNDSVELFTPEKLADLRTRVHNQLAGLTDPTQEQASAEILKMPTAVVASANGTKYYPVNCTAAKRLSQNSLLAFASAQEAEIAGYSRSTQCSK